MGDDMNDPRLDEEYELIYGPTIIPEDETPRERELRETLQEERLLALENSRESKRALDEQHERLDQDHAEKEAELQARLFEEKEQGKKFRNLLRENGISHHDNGLERSPTVDEQLDENDLPALPKLVYDRLPDILARCCKALPLWHERDVFLTGALGTCSAILPNVRFRYGKKWYSPHVFLFILAEAGRGKGILSHALSLADGIDDLLADEYEYELDDWKERTKAYEQLKKGQKGESPGPQPPEVLLRAAEDMNLPVLYRTLANNPEGVLIGATEADIISQANRRDSGLGGFSALFRQAFEHERAQKSTKSEGTIRIPLPRLALVLSGTRNQFAPLVDSVENGLFSRFAVYRFMAPLEYRSQRLQDEDKEFETALKHARGKLKELYKKLRNRNEPLYVTTPIDLWNSIDARFETLFNTTLKDAGAPGELAATIYRGAVTCFRIAAILCVLRQFDEGVNVERTRSLEVGEKDVEAATELSLVYVEQSMRQALDMLKESSVGVINALSQTGGAGRITGRQQSFLQALPKTFDRAEAITIGNSLSIPQRTVDRWLGQWVKKDSAILEQPQHGRYATKGPGSSDKVGKVGKVIDSGMKNAVFDDEEIGKVGKHSENGKVANFANSANFANPDNRENPQNQLNLAEFANFANFANRGMIYREDEEKAPF